MRDKDSGRFAEACRAFARALEDASTPQELSRRLEEAQRTYRTGLA